MRGGRDKSSYGGGGGGLFPGTSHKLAAPQIDNLMQATPLPFPSLLPTAKLGPPTPPQAMDPPSHAQTGEKQIEPK
jgi:hypothetical protein